MFRENEDKIMKAPGICFDGSSCWHMFAPYVRVKRPGSHVKDLHWLCILLLLVVLLAGQASCNETTASPLSSPTTNAQTSVFYHVAVTVDVNGQKDESNITAWLEDVFRNNLQSCVSQINKQTTAPPASPHTTSASTSNVTTLMTPATATLQSSNTTTAAANTTLQSYSTTPAATTFRSSNTTTTATTASESSNTTSPATTAVKGSSTTTPATTAVKGSNTTATTAFKTPTMTIASTTALQSTIITTPATTASKTTTMATAATTASETTTMATPATTASKTTTVATAATTASETTTVATAATTTAVKSTTMTTFATTALKTSTKTATATTTASETIKTTTLPVTGVITQTALSEDQNRPTKRPPPSQANKERVAREIRNSVTQTRYPVSPESLSPAVLGIEVSCATKTAIRKTNCSVTLQLRHSIPPCCILRTLCAASKNSSDIHVVGKSADRVRGLENECNSNIQEEKSCVYTGQAGAACQESESAYVIPQRNTTHCDAEKGNNVCNCSAYCSGTDAYYTFEIFIKDTSKMNLTYVLSLISKLKQQPNCSPSAEVPCPSSILASEYTDANVTCGLNEADLQSCRVILVFAHEVPICNVSTAVINVFQSVKEISFNGQVTRAAICGNSEVNSNPLKSEFKWDIVYLKRASFCTIEESNLNLTCPNGVNVLVQMDEQCNQRVFTTPSPNVTTTLSPNVTTTLSPNVTTAEPNTTTSSVNVTSPLNTTVTAQPNTTTLSANVTSSPLNTTAQALNATTTSSPANITATADSQANALLDLTRDVSSLNSSQVDQLVSQLENLLSGPTVSLALGNTSVHIVSNLLGASPEVLSDSSNRIIGIVDTVGLKLVLDGEAQTLLSPAVALSVKPADGSNFQETFFSISDPNDVQVRGDPRLRRSVRKGSSIPQGSIRLPPTLTQSLTSEQQQLVSRVQFNFYQESTVYQDRSLGKRKLNSGILGASVANLSIKELQDDVVIHLKNMEPVPANFVATCVFWDFTLNDGSGGWNPRGCSVRNSTDNETICGCNHLTSFAILLDLSRETLTSRVQATILTFITYIGCGISAIFLSITLLTYLSFGKLRKDIPSKILIQLCMALLLLNLVFLVDAWLALYPDAVGLCISTAWFLHYFLLVTFTWMGLEAVHMYVALVKVFNSHISRYMLKFSVVGWGVPMIVVIIVIAIDKDNYGLVSYGKFSDGTSDDFCWLKNDIAFYVAVVAYFCVIFLFNLAMFVVVLVQLCRIKRQNPHNAQHRTTLQDARSVAGITVLLGLTWGFAFFAWGPLNLPFMYLFAIFNSLQGFFIFVFYCAVKENVRRQWRTYLCCGKMRLAENSEWSRTATQKTVKKSSMTKLRSLNSSKSSQSNNSSSSTSFLVSDSSEQINGIGSPFEDRIITADEDPSMDVVLNEINRQYRDRQAS